MSKASLLGLLLTTLDAYDVNVSPDKKTILLHEQTALLDSIRVCPSLSPSLENITRIKSDGHRSP